MRDYPATCFELKIGDRVAGAARQGTVVGPQCSAARLYSVLGAEEYRRSFLGHHERLAEGIGGQRQLVLSGNMSEGFSMCQTCPPFLTAKS